LENFLDNVTEVVAEPKSEIIITKISEVSRNTG
jgi:hypothetical protein